MDDVGLPDRAAEDAQGVTKDDPYSNSLKIVEPAASARTLTLTPPAAQPEALDDGRDFPYLTALAGAKLLNTTSSTRRAPSSPTTRRTAARSGRGSSRKAPTAGMPP